MKKQKRLKAHEEITQLRIENQQLRSRAEQLSHWYDAEESKVRALRQELAIVRAELSRYKAASVDTQPHAEPV